MARKNYKVKMKNDIGYGVLFVINPTGKFTHLNVNVLIMYSFSFLFILTDTTMVPGTKSNTSKARNQLPEHDEFHDISEGGLGAARQRCF